MWCDDCELIWAFNDFLCAHFSWFHVELVSLFLGAVRPSCMFKIQCFFAETTHSSSQNELQQTFGNCSNYRDRITHMLISCKQQAFLKHMICLLTKSWQPLRGFASDSGFPCKSTIAVDINWKQNNWQCQEINGRVSDYWMCHCYCHNLFQHRATCSFSRALCQTFLHRTVPVKVKVRMKT